MISYACACFDCSLKLGMYENDGCTSGQAKRRTQKLRRTQTLLVNKSWMAKPLTTALDPNCQERWHAWGAGTPYNVQPTAKEGALGWGHRAHSTSWSRRSPTISLWWGRKEGLREAIDMYLLHHATVWVEANVEPCIMAAAMFPKMSRMANLRPFADLLPKLLVDAASSSSFRGPFWIISLQSWGDGNCMGGSWSSRLIQRRQMASQFVMKSWQHSRVWPKTRRAGSGIQYPWLTPLFFILCVSMLSVGERD